MVLQAKVKKDIDKLLDLIKDGLGISVGGVLRRFFMALFNFKAKPSEYRDILKRLNQLGHTTDQLANTILALMVTSSVELTLGEEVPKTGTHVAHLNLS